jgi:hypothetical protein
MLGWTHTDVSLRSNRRSGCSRTLPLDSSSTLAVWVGDFSQSLSATRQITAEVPPPQLFSVSQRRAIQTIQAAEQSQTRQGVVGEHWASFVQACGIPGNSRPLSLADLKRERELRSRPAWSNSAGDRTRSRGGGGEPGRFSLATLFWASKRKAPGPGRGLYG